MRKFHWLFLALVVFMFSLNSVHAADPQYETFEGRLKIQRADNFVTGVSTTTYYFIMASVGGDQKLTLNFSDNRIAAPLRSGDRVAVTGTLSGTSINVRTLQPVATRSSAGATVGALDIPEFAAAIEDRRAVILIVSLNDAPNPLSVGDIEGFMYTDTRNVNDLFKVSSFQQLGFNPDTDSNDQPDIFGPFTVDYQVADGCLEDSWAAAANAAASGAGVDLSLYQHKVYLLPPEADCGWSGLGSVGCSSYYCSVWVKEGGGPVLAHELGHNLGWHHASTDPENDGRINSEYGDRSGVMGYPYWSQVNAPHRDQRRWFDAFAGSLVTAQTSGSFELHALELDPGVDDVGTQVVKIRKEDTDEHYYLSYRRRIGNYPVNSGYADQINIHRSAGPGSSSVHLTNLEQGETFTDEINNISMAAGATGGETASVTVILAGAPINQPPTASFSYNADGMGVQFADTSQDTDGAIAARVWDFGDGTTATTANPSHTYASPDTYIVRLVVTDDDGSMAAATRQVLIVDPDGNQPPTASFSFDIRNLKIEFTDASNDSDGAIVARTWDFGDGNGSSQTNPTHTYAAPGTYAVTLVVTDEDGATASSESSLTTNLPPAADFSMTVNGRQVSFGQKCTDNDGSIQTYTWDFGDGNASTDADPVHTYAAEGSFTVTLTVQDNDGASASMTVDLDLASDAATSTPALDASGGGSDSGSSGACFIQTLPNPTWPLSP